MDYPWMIHEQAMGKTLHRNPWRRMDPGLSMDDSLIFHGLAWNIHGLSKIIYGVCGLSMEWQSTINTEQV